MKMTDGNRTIEITMKTWNGTGYTPDFSNDFFVAGSLSRVWVDRLNEEVFFVEDVSYCIDCANDWKNSQGDFCCDEPNENNFVFVYDI